MVKNTCSEEIVTKLSVDDEKQEEVINLCISSIGSSRKKLLVLDINGLLADIVSPPPKNVTRDTTISRKAVFKRPFYLEFLNFCFERFDVAVWSSRLKYSST
ncbi:hypothetical protein KIW84_036139 [Lathyrus oleraceus]|uniref:Mitochondrial import inner membrane translocase subunit TIM50 n=1 Tax=Pisum sativum TaxID=3888 RepID=A0A9D5B1T4_PEA|nr:hypothetical protein KIW84_036139 [Pisum sativum]